MPRYPAAARGHLLRHPAHRAQAPRQLHRGDPPVRRGPGPRRPGDLLHRRPARARRSPTTRPSCAGARATRRRCWSPPGLDPERCILFRQGDVPEHTELTWLLSSVTSVGELNRMHQFRDKSGAAARAGRPPGCSIYPVLMAADVLAYRAHEVPVGEDQREHIELMRDVARGASTSASARRWSCPRATSRRSARACATSRSPSARCRPPAARRRAPSTSLDEPDAIARSSSGAHDRLRARDRRAPTTSPASRT